MSLPVPNSPLPAPTNQGWPTGQVEFLMFGYRRADGGVELYASRDVPWVQLDLEYPELRGWDFANLEPSGPAKITLTARVTDYVQAHGADMRSALANLANFWGAR